MAAAQAAVNQQRARSIGRGRATAGARLTWRDWTHSRLPPRTGSKRSAPRKRRVDRPKSRVRKWTRRWLEPPSGYAGDYTAALGLVDEVLARDSQYPAALSLRAEVQGALEEEKKHPVEGFSLWPTLSSATVWLRTKAIYSNTFRITVGLVLAVAVAFGVWRAPPMPHKG